MTRNPQLHQEKVKASVVYLIQPDDRCEDLILLVLFIHFHEIEERKLSKKISFGNELKKE